MTIKVPREQQQARKHSTGIKHPDLFDNKSKQTTTTKTTITGFTKIVRKKDTENVREQKKTNRRKKERTRGERVECVW